MYYYFRVSLSICLGTCIHVEKLQCSAKSNPTFRYELSQTSYSPLPRSSISAPSPSLLYRLAAQTRTKGTEGKGRSPMKRTRRKQPPAGQPCPPPLAPRKRAAFCFLGKEQGVNRRERHHARCVTGWVANRHGQRDRGHERFAFFADSSHRSELQWKRCPLGEGPACFHMRISNRGLTAPATADLFT